MEQDWNTFFNPKTSSGNRQSALDKMKFAGADPKQKTERKQVMVDLYTEDIENLAPIVKDFDEGKISKQQAQSKIKGASANPLLKNRASEIVNLANIVNEFEKKKITETQARNEIQGTSGPYFLKNSATQQVYSDSWDRTYPKEKSANPFNSPGRIYGW